jgi:very-short-patch-repair endonuclease
MDEQAGADERTYWAEQLRSRQADVEAAEERGEPAHVLAGLRLRLQEAMLRNEALG